MKVDVKFRDDNKHLDFKLDQFQNVSDGGYERGYAAGYTEGKTASEDFLVSLANKTISEFVPSTPLTMVVDYAFYYCRKLKIFDGSKVRSIGTSGFRYCDSIETLTFPVCTQIRGYAINSCTNLKLVDFGALEDIISVSNFSSSNVESVIIRTNKVCYLANTNAFGNTPIAEGTGYIYVPANLVESYKTATNWVTYASQIRSIDELEET